MEGGFQTELAMAFDSAAGAVVGRLLVGSLLRQWRLSP